MTWPRYLAIAAARTTRKPTTKRGDFADLVNFLGADPAASRGAILK